MDTIASRSKMSGAQSGQTEAHNEKQDDALSDTIDLTMIDDSILSPNSNDDNSNIMASKGVNRALKGEFDYEENNFEISALEKPKKKKKTTKSYSFTPSTITIGRHRDRPEDSIYARMIEKVGKWAHPHFNNGSWPRNFKDADILFDAEYWRGSVPETKAYIATLFTRIDAVADLGATSNDPEMQQPGADSKKRKAPDSETPFKSRKARNPTNPTKRRESRKVRAKEVDSVRPPQYKSPYLVEDRENSLVYPAAVEEAQDGETNTQEESPAVDDQEHTQDLTQLSALLGPDSQSAFGSVTDSLGNLASLVATSESRISELEGEVEGLEADLGEHRITIDELSKENWDHEKTISGQKVVIKEHISTIQHLRSKLQQSRTVQPDNGVPSPVDVDGFRSQILHLEQQVKTSKAQLKAQAQKITDFNKQPEGKRAEIIVRLQSENESKDNKIKELELQLKQSCDSSRVIKLEDVSLQGSRFQDSFVKVPASSGGSLYKERSGLKFVDESGQWWQRTRMLQDSITVAGTPTNEPETINGANYDSFDENGKQKRLKHLDESSLVKHDGKFYVEWVILKETEPEEFENTF